MSRAQRHARITRIIFMLERVGLQRLGFITRPPAPRTFTFIKPSVLKPLILGR